MMRAAYVTELGISRRFLRVRIATRLALEESAKAHHLMEDGTRGRIVVLP